jgi:hypothetical protein
LVLEEIGGTRTLHKCYVPAATRNRPPQTPRSSKLWQPRAWKQCG